MRTRSALRQRIAEQEVSQSRLVDELAASEVRAAQQSTLMRWRRHTTRWKEELRFKRVDEEIQRTLEEDRAELEAVVQNLADLKRRKAELAALRRTRAESPPLLFVEASGRIEDALRVLRRLSDEHEMNALDALRVKQTDLQQRILDLKMDIPPIDAQEMLVSATHDRQQAEERQADAEESRRPQIARRASRLRERSDSLRRELEPNLRRLPQLERQLGELLKADQRAFEQLQAKTGDQPALLTKKIEANLALYPRLHNLRAKAADLRNEIAEIRRQSSELDSMRAELAVTLSKLGEVAGSARSNRRKGPPRMVVLDWKQAEQLACQYLRWLGFMDAELTESGADGGVDVRSTKAVAQVKMHNTGTGRPEVQQLFGVAAAERTKAFMFAMSYSREAIEWAQRHGVALFRFTRSGNVEPVTREAELACVRLR